jgi:hypothetical protein
MHRPAPLGAAVGVLLLAVHFAAGEQASVPFAAVVLSIIAGAYLGFAFADGRLQAISVEVAGCTAFGLAAWIGLVAWPPAIPLAILVHGLWDLAHHRRELGARVPLWYPGFCALVDLVLGGVLLAVYLG